MTVAIQEIKNGVAAGIKIGVPIAGREIYEQAPCFAKGLRIDRVRPAGVDLGVGSPGQEEGEHRETEKLFHCSKVFAVRLSYPLLLRY
jgi:hypothetical protein